MSANQKTIEKVEKAFSNFNKFETYATAFEAMDKRQITLKEIKEIAHKVASIDGGIIEMRRSDWNHWS